MKRVSGWMAAASCLLAVPAMASDDVDAKLAEMQKLVTGLQEKVQAQDEQIEHQSKMLEDAQRVVRADQQGTLSGLAAFIDSLDVDGGVVFWSLSEWTDRDTLHALITHAGGEVINNLPPP